MTTGSLFWTLVILSAGGFFVLVGLLMEQLGEKGWYKNVTQFRLYKRIRFWGEWLVIVGVLIEVVEAGLTAKTEWQNDPLTKPVAFASARVSMIIKTRSNTTSPFLPERTQYGWNAGITFSNQKASNAVFGLSANTCALWRMGTTNEQECRIEFREDPLDFLEDESRRTKTLLKQFNDVDAFSMHLPELETNAEIVSGIVVLNVNDSTWTFVIPSQVTKWGAVTMKKTKDTNGKDKAEIWPVQVVDFIYPPRFTNLWYDGK